MMLTAWKDFEAYSAPSLLPFDAMSGAPRIEADGRRVALHQRVLGKPADCRQL